METVKGTLSRRRLGAAAAAGGLALGGCSAMLTQPPLAVSVISFGGGFNLPLWAAREQGLFARNGIAVQLVITADSRQVFAGLMRGDYQIAITALDNIVAYQEGQGEVKFDPPSDFFAFMASDDGFLSLVAQPGIRRVADLRGQLISVDAMGNGFSFALREILARNGLAESDVRWERAGGTDRRYAALIEGRHAATMLRAPFDIQALARGFHQLATAREVLGPYAGIVGAARRSWARDHEAAVVGFIRAYRDAIVWLKAVPNRAAAQALLVADVPGMTPELAARSCELMLDPDSGFFSDVRLDGQGVRAVMDLRSRLAEPPRQLGDADKYVDQHYWQLAQRR